MITFLSLDQRFFNANNRALAGEDLIQLLDLLHEEVNSLNGQFQDLCNIQRNCASEMGFSCPLEQSTGPGRPRFCIPEEVTRGSHDIHGVWKEVANEARVSYKTILRRRHQYSLNGLHDLLMTWGHLVWSG